MPNIDYLRLPYRSGVHRALRSPWAVFARVRLGEKTPAPIGPVAVGRAELGLLANRIATLMAERRIAHVRFFRGTRTLKDSAIVVVEERVGLAGAGWVIFDLRTKGDDVFIDVQQAWPWRPTILQFLVGIPTGAFLGAAVLLAGSFFRTFLWAVFRHEETPPPWTAVLTMGLVALSVLSPVFLAVLGPSARTQRETEVLFAAAKGVAIQAVGNPPLSTAPTSSSLRGPDRASW